VEVSEATATVLEAAGAAGYRERHIAGLGCDAEFSEQRRESRVGGLVVDEEAGIEVELLVRQGDGVGVTAKIGVALEDRNLVLRRKKVCGDKAADAGADDRDLHEGGILWN
jgi:hypothetical protein